jgi:predicted GH43/DUF377 family glycosyl hydrolase
MKTLRVTLAHFSLQIVLLNLLVAQAGPPLPFRDWHRISDAPILAPRGTGWESAGTFNPAVVIRGDKVVMLYRAQDKQGTSRIGYAESPDGIHFTRRDDPVLSPSAPYEENGGVEDPRLVQFGDTYYLTYTGYNKIDAQLCLATSKDLVHWQRQGVIISANKGNWNVKWTKSGAIVPEKIDGKYWMYFLGTSTDNKDQAGLAFSGDLMHWTEATRTPVLPVRPGQFDSRVAEPGPSPIITPKVIWRSDRPILQPEKEWEQVGQVPNVVFVEGMVQRGERYLFYYGAADKYVGVAETPIPH